MVRRSVPFDTPEREPMNLPANIRTLIPVIVGVIVGAAVHYASSRGIVIPEGSLAEVVTPVVSGAVTVAYFAAGRFLETRVPARVRTVGRVLLTWGLTRQTPAYGPAGEVEASRAAA
ncbi:hypothetical protein [Nocardiopsis sp. CA-288880]|uniref:hypothetical protein n=1 Tax=Nocardiopsis sp. CA-288880 TaxID=3239995 RepID=UPI003D996E0C